MDRHFENWGSNNKYPECGAVKILDVKGGCMDDSWIGCNGVVPSLMAGE